MRGHNIGFTLLILSGSPVFSSPGRSPGRAIELPPALAAAALAKSLTLKYFM